MNRSPGSISAVIVTGGGGLIGSHLRRRHGDAVEFFSAQRSEGFDLLYRTSVFQFVKAHAEETYCLVHLAAYTDVTAANRQKGKKDELCHRINVDGTRHALALAARPERRAVRVKQAPCEPHARSARRWSHWDTRRGQDGVGAIGARETGAGAPHRML